MGIKKTCDPQDKESVLAAQEAEKPSVTVATVETSEAAATEPKRKRRSAQVKASPMETTPDKAAQAASVPSKDNDEAPSVEKQKKVKGGKSAKQEELQAKAVGAAAPAQDATQHVAF